VGALVGLIGGLFGILLGSGVFGLLYVQRPGMNPAAFVWNVLARAAGWAFIGALAGTADGWRKWSFRVGRNGFIGGLIGGLIGGTTFEIVPYLAPGMTRPGVLSRLFGFVITGAMIGLFVALVQQLLKEAWVRVMVGRNEGREYLVEKAQTTIGRSELCDVPLFGDPSVERTHAVIAARPDGRFVLRDNNTQGGTIVNDERVSPGNGEGVLLRDGDRIRIAGRTLIFHERYTQRRRAPAPKTWPHRRDRQAAAPQRRAARRPRSPTACRPSWRAAAAAATASPPQRFPHPHRAAAAAMRRVWSPWPGRTRARLFRSAGRLPTARLPLGATRTATSLCPTIAKRRAFMRAGARRRGLRHRGRRLDQRHLRQRRKNLAPNAGIGRHGACRGHRPAL
jgi:hypothetical protein